MTNQPLYTSTTPETAAAALNGANPWYGHGGCDGSRWFRSFDTDYPCDGCMNCGGDKAKAAFAIGMFVWLATHLEARMTVARALTGLACLAKIGKAVAAAGKLGTKVQAFFTGAVASYNTLRKGQWYQVTGKRGNAKAAFGAIGECVWIGEVAGGTSWAPTTTTRVGLKPLTGETVWVPASCISRVDAPAGATEAVAAREAEKQAKAAARAALPAFTGKKGSKATVTTGRDQGATGKVFWLGQGRGGIARVGLKTADNRTIWVDATEVAAA